MLVSGLNSAYSRLLIVLDSVNPFEFYNLNEDAESSFHSLSYLKKYVNEGFHY